MHNKYTWQQENQIMEEIKHQLQALQGNVIDKDDFINAIEEIYWHYEGK